MIRFFRIFAIFIFLFILSCKQAAPESEQEKSPQSQSAQVHNISAGEAQKLISEGDVLIIDVRTAEEIAGGMIAGAKHADVLNGSDYQKFIDQIDLSQPVVVYCKVGGRSQKAADMLIAKGFSTVYNISGGFDAWKAADLPIATN